MGLIGGDKAHSRLRPGDQNGRNPRFRNKGARRLFHLIVGIAGHATRRDHFLAVGGQQRDPGITAEIP